MTYFNTMNQFSKLLSSLLFIGVIAFSSTAQPPKENASKREKVEQLKIAYITKELNLTSEEAKAFWPLYNAMTTEISTERKKRRKLAQQLKANLETLSEEEIKTKTQEMLDSEIAESKLKKEHLEKIAGVVGYKKAVTLLALEQQFKKELLKRLNQQGQTKPN